MKQPAGTSIGIVKTPKVGHQVVFGKFSKDTGHKFDNNRSEESPVTVIAAVEDLVHNAAENCVFDCSEDKSERRDTLIV